jgi:undecaprenyl diphosphate synthase
VYPVLNKLFGTSTKEVQKPLQVDTLGLNPERIPAHIAIIMDGNGRWAKAQGKVRTYGHQVGAQTLKTIVRFAGQIGVKAITAYAFSTENWKRPVTEVKFIMELLSYYLTAEIDELNANNVQMRFSGSREGLPPAILKKMDTAVAVTKNNTGVILNIAVNYGGQDEILHAVRAIATQVRAGTLKVEDISAAVFEDNLYTHGLPAPDLLIRPGGDQRISNFLLWQIAYAEIWTTDVYWPDFTPALLVEAIKAYQGRERRFGGLVNK